MSDFSSSEIPNRSDTISRQAAIDAMSCVNDSICGQQAIDALWELPTIDYVKHGKWIKNKDRCGWYCSECKEDDLYAYSWSCEKGEYEFQDRYCPKCGAKMDEETEHETE